MILFNRARASARAGFTSMVNSKDTVSPSRSVAVSVYSLPCAFVGVVGVPLIRPPCVSSASGFT